MGFYTSRVSIQRSTEYESDALPTEPLGLIQTISAYVKTKIPEKETWSTIGNAWVGNSIRAQSPPSPILFTHPPPPLSTQTAKCFWIAWHIRYFSSVPEQCFVARAHVVQLAVTQPTSCSTIVYCCSTGASPIVSSRLSIKSRVASSGNANTEIRLPQIIIIIMTDWINE